MGDAAAGFVSQLLDRLGPERVLVDPASLERASRDESDSRPQRPIAVIVPELHEEVVEVVLAASRWSVPLTARGGGSGLEGGAIPEPGGAVVDFSRMNRILDVSIEDRFVLVEPGVVFARLNRFLAQHGLFFPSSPGGSGEVATIGGMVSTNASGTLALMYGGTDAWVKTLRVVTGTGETLVLGHRVHKASEGPDLVKLFVGAEGTLGLVTQVGLGLAPIPEAKERGGAVFRSDEAALFAGMQVASYVPSVAGLEYLDSRTVSLLRSVHDETLPQGAILLFETHGQGETARTALEACRSVAEDGGGLWLDSVERTFQLRERITATVREVQGAVIRTDSAVPRSKAAEFIEGVRRTVREAGLSAHCFGHVGVGIFHVLIPVAPGERDERTEVKYRLMELALSLGGAISGEHGIGRGAPSLFSRRRPQFSKVFRVLKAAMDPQGLLNKGKLVP